MPSNSWVARWNKLEDKKPGIYAITVLDEEFQQDDSYEEIDEKPKKQRKAKNKEGIFSDEDVEEYYKLN